MTEDWSEKSADKIVEDALKVSGNIGDSAVYTEGVVIPLGKEEAERRKANRTTRKKVKRTAGAGAAVAAAAAMITYGAAKVLEKGSVPAEEIVKKTVWLDKQADGSGKIVDQDGNEIKINATGKIAGITETDNYIHTIALDLERFGKLDNDNCNISFDSHGNVKLTIKEKDTNNIWNMTLTYEQALQKLPALFDANQVEIRTYEYMLAQENPIEREISSADSIVTAVANELFYGEGIDGANYTMKLNSTYDHSVGNALHKITFVAKEGSGRQDVSKDVSFDQFEKAYDWAIDGIRDDDNFDDIKAWGMSQKALMALEQQLMYYEGSIRDLIAGWEGTNETLRNTINNYEQQIVNLSTNYTQRIQSIMSDNNLTIEQLITQLNNTINDVYNNTRRTVEFTDTQTFLTTYYRLDSEDRKYMLKNESEADSLFDGVDAEFEVSRVVIPGDIHQNATNTVNVSGDGDYVIDNIPRDKAEKIYQKYWESRGELGATQWKETTVADVGGIKNIYDILGAYDAEHNTSYRNKFMKEADVARLTDGNNSNEEAVNITIKRALAENIPGQIIYNVKRADGNISEIKAYKDPEFIKLLDEIVG